MFSFFLFFPLFSLSALHSLWALGSPARGWHWAARVQALSPGCWTDREFPGPGNINQYASPGDIHLNTKILHHPTACRLQSVLDTSCQTTSETGTKPQTSADRLPKVILSSQTPPKHHLTWPCPSEGKDSAPPTRTQAPVPPTRKPAQAPGPNSPTREQTTERRGMTTLQPVERRPQTQ